MTKVQGVWVFNAVLTDAGTEGSVTSGQTVSFTSNGGVFDRIIPIAGYQSVMTYSNIEYSYSVYSHSDGWTNEAFKVIDFGATEQEVTDEFYTWLTANATPEEDEPDEPMTGDVLLAIWKSTLDGIADAVREKTGKTEEMLGSEIEDEIRSLKSLKKFDGTVEVI
jgi:hypothetical protein